MAKDRSVFTQAIPPPVRKDGDGKEIGNLILLALPQKECTQIFPLLEFVRLNLHHVMHEAGEVIKSAYFLNNGMASVLTVLPDGKSVEVGLIGKEGFVGSSVVFGFKTCPLRVVVQGDATAYRVDVPTLRKILPQCPQLEKQIQRFAMVLAMQSTQLAACNRLHDVEERLARWLMMSKPDWRRDNAIDSRVLRSNAWRSQVKCQRCSQRFAKGRNDYVHERKRDHPR
jgi:CRP-like cAMP-binding protein